MRRLRSWSRRTQLLAAAGALLVLIAAVAVTAVVTAAPRVHTRSQFITGTAEPGHGAVRLDTTLYLPEHTPAPAVLLAHGFGGSKSDLAGQARNLAQHGFVVLAYTARGFGRSGGLIHLDAPSYEVADARKLIGYLGTLPQVERDHPGDPRVAVAGSSYGGALALLTAAYDHRVDAVAADITWNDLTTALFPNAAGGDPTVTTGGVFKKLWAAYLFGNGGSGTSTGGSGASASASGTSPSGTSTSGPATTSSSACGRFAAQLCSAYQQLAQGKSVDLSLLGLLTQSSPASVLNRIDAPTLLTQGEQDSLFPLSQADANARGIAAHGTPVSVLWRLGGHDTGAGTDVAETAARSWFDAVLKHHTVPRDGFSLTLQGGGISAENGRPVSQTLTARAGYPGVRGAIAKTTTVTVRGTGTEITAPAGGSPAAISSLPGLSSLLSAASGTSLFSGLTNLPGQVAGFTSAPLSAQLRATGASTVTLDVTPRTTSDATLFVSLQDVAPDGSTTLPAQLVAPVSLVGLRAGHVQQVRINLPSVVYDFEARHRIRLTVSTTDQGYALPSDPRAYSISLPGGTSAVSVPTVATADAPDRSPLVWLGLGLLAVVVAVAAATTLSRRSQRGPAAAADAGSRNEPGEIPVVVRDLVKEYGDGFRAVDGVSFQVERGQIVGLLGPNGAGKTTALRVLMGLIHPTAGSVHIFGAPVVPGAAVLSRVGAFVEGPGLLPHLSGRDNLRLSWAASGRSAGESQLDTALEIAGLGSSIDRRVKTYSQGMRQRLAIAQSMLGLPELLILDEPTNGLDPPQIAEMRLVLRSYAETGRTVVISSHLLAEVEQTCSHVVVMHRGRLIAAGSVDEIARSDEVTLAVADPARARSVLAAAGITASEVPSRRGLEEVFLDLVGED